MSRTAKLLEQAYAIYEHEGQGAVERWAEGVEIAPFVEALHCEPCESAEPHIGGICAVCGTATWAADGSPSGREAGSSAGGSQDRREVDYEVTLSLAPGQRQPSERELQLAIYRDTEADAIEAIEVTRRVANGY